MRKFVLSLAQELTKLGRCKSQAEVFSDDDVFFSPTLKGRTLRCVVVELCMPSVLALCYEHVVMMTLLQTQRRKPSGTNSAGSGARLELGSTS